MKLSEAETAVLQALVGDQVLRVHRDMDGAKVARLHCLDGPVQAVPRQVIERLEAQGCIAGNHKFPVATYLLTEQGLRVLRARRRCGGNWRVWLRRQVLAIKTWVIRRWGRDH